MTCISVRGVILILAGISAVHAAAADPRPLPAGPPGDPGAVLQDVLTRHRVPGLAAVVLQGDRIVAEGVAGVRKSGATERITLNDRFLLCSGTKAMTATLVARAIEAGRLSCTSTLGDLVSTNFPHLHPAWKTVTVAELLEHRAGVPTERGRFWTLLSLHFSRQPEAEKRRSIVEKILSRPPKYPPDSKYVYTALDYVIVGELLEQIYGRSWEDLMREELWQPLGITTGGFGTPGTPGKTDQPWGHWGAVFTGCPVSPGGFWARLSMPAFLGPGGAVHMTITDWARFISLHLRGDPANPYHQAALLTSDSFATLHRAPPGSSYEAGWFVETRVWANGGRAGDTGRVIASLGDNGFWHTEAWVAPEIDFAVLVVCNQGGVGSRPAGLACDDAVRSLMQDFLQPRKQTTMTNSIGNL